MGILPAHTSLLSAETAKSVLSLSLFSRYKVLCMCLWLWEMKYSSHKKWLSSLSSTTLYNEGPVQAETRGIVTRQHTHIRSPKDTLGVEEPQSALTTTSHAGLLAFFSTFWILALYWEGVCSSQAAKSTHKKARIRWSEREGRKVPLNIIKGAVWGTELVALRAQPCKQ